MAARLARSRPGRPSSRTLRATICIAVAGSKDTGARLEERELDALGPHLRVALLQLVVSHDLVGDSELLEDALRRAQLLRPGGRELEPTRREHQALAELPFPRLPLLERSQHPPGVDLLVAVAHADLACLPAGSGATIPGTVRVEKRDRVAHLPEVKRGPAAEGTRADHHDIRRGLGSNERRRHGRGRRLQETSFDRNVPLRPHFAS